MASGKGGRRRSRQRGDAGREARPERVAGDEWVYGQHAAREVAAYHPAGVVGVWVEHCRRDGRTERMLDRLRRQGVPIHRVGRQELDYWTEGANHQGILLRYRGIAAQGEAELDGFLAAESEPLFLVLDQVQDPHNLGACLRTAAAAGAQGVIAPRDRAAALTPTVHKTAAGAVQHIPFFQVTNLARTLERVADAGVFVVGAAGEAAQACYDVDLRGPLALVLGGEGEGLRRLTRERCDVLVTIPMPGRVESLNVSVATGVLLFEALRQRRAATGF